MEAKEYAYIRVSSRDQNEDRQKIAMVEYGIAPGNIYMDKQSGKDFERPGYQRLLRKLKAGDTIVVKSIDRLGRNYDEILEQWRFLTKQKTGGYHRSGYAAAQHKTGQGFDWRGDRGHCFAASLLCCTDGAGV